MLMVSFCHAEAFSLMKTHFVYFRFVDSPEDVSRKSVAEDLMSKKYAAYVFFWFYGFSLNIYALESILG